MTNPHLKLKLNRMMADEQSEKKELISCIIDYYIKRTPKMNIFAEICNLMELSINELSQLIEEITNEQGNILLRGINLN